MAEQRAPHPDDAAETPTRSAAADATRAQVESESRTSPRTAADMDAPRSDAPETRETPATGSTRRRRSTTTKSSGGAAGTRSGRTSSRRRTSGTTTDGASTGASGGKKAARPARRRGATASDTTAKRTTSGNGPTSASTGTGRGRRRKTDASADTPSASARVSAASAPSSTPTPSQSRQHPSPSSITDRATASVEHLFDGPPMSDEAGQLAQRLVRTVRSAPKGVVATVGVLLALFLYWRIRR